MRDLIYILTVFTMVVVIELFVGHPFSAGYDYGFWAVWGVLAYKCLKWLVEPKGY